MNVGVFRQNNILGVRELGIDVGAELRNDLLPLPRGRWLDSLPGDAHDPSPSVCAPIAGGGGLRNRVERCSGSWSAHHRARWQHGR